MLQGGPHFPSVRSPSIHTIPSRPKTKTETVTEGDHDQDDDTSSAQAGGAAQSHAAARADALVASYERAGYARVAPAILQPAEPFLDLSGEDIRRACISPPTPAGRELCLRPDLTIPVSCDYLASPAAGQPAGFCYLGPVFRHRGDGAGEFLQAGIESFGRSDIAAADAEMLALGLEATAALRRRDARHPHGRCRTVRGAGRARSTSRRPGSGG